MYFLRFQIEVIFPEDSMQNERQFLWTLEQAGADTFDLKRAGTACDREFDIDITVWCRSVSLFVFLISQTAGQAPKNVT